VARITLHAYLGHLEDTFLDSHRQLAHGIGTAANGKTRARHIPWTLASYRFMSVRADRTLAMLWRRRCSSNWNVADAKPLIFALRKGWRWIFLPRPPDSLPTLIQVCLDTSAPATWEREVRALSAAAAEIPGSSALLLTLDSTPPRPPLPAPLHWRSAAAWLLDSF